METKLVLQSY